MSQRIPPLFAATLLFCLVSLAMGGCATTASYTTPGAAVDVSALVEPDLREAYTREPASPFPARLAVARVQSSGYRSGHGASMRRTHGTGRYSVHTARDIETDDDLARIVALPGVAAVAPIGRILVPDRLESIRDLREPAANLRADLLLIYTVDTTFVVDGTPLGPLSLITLGFIPNRVAHVTSTTSAALLDVRTGFIYGTTEATAVEDERHSRWSTSISIENARRAAERGSFVGLVENFERLWRDVVAEHFARSAGA